LNHFILKSCVIQARAEAPPNEDAAEVMTKTLPSGLKNAPIVEAVLPARYGTSESLNSSRNLLGL
jgi:hypothetical protein